MENVISKIVRLCDHGQMESYFNTKETLVEFLLSSKGGNQNFKTLTQFHGCESSYSSEVQLTLFGYG